jgi:hypothetical protein
MPEDHRDHSRALVLHPLVYLDEDEGVVIGRPDIDSYAIFPADGAELVRRLQTGATPRDAATWYSSRYGSETDIDHLLGALDELGFIASDDTTAPAVRPVRFQRLGQALFSPPAWIAYGVLVAWAAVAMLGAPDLVPTYRDLFFSPYYTVITVVLFAGTAPLLLLHETFHALAARRIGVRSRLRISRRLYYVVLETALDGLVAVPRARRYLPILAGMVADVLALAVLTVIADLTREPTGGLSYTGHLCQAFAFATVLRVVWQFFFYLRTDIYVLITTVLGCVDLHSTTKRMLANRFRLRSRADRLAAEATLPEVDRTAARWYSWLFVVGYTFSIATFVVAAGPAAYQMFAGVLGRFWGAGASWGGLLDSLIFLGLNVYQAALTVWLGLRERRQRRALRFQHVLG